MLRGTTGYECQDGAGYEGGGSARVNAYVTNVHKGHVLVGYIAV